MILYQFDPIFISQLDFSAIPTDCRRRIEWAFKKGRKKQNASKWYKRMKEISGVDVEDATLYDFQRFFKCTKKRFLPCRDLFFPETCSTPPCNQCPAGKGNTMYFLTLLVDKI